MKNVVLFFGLFLLVFQVHAQDGAWKSDDGTTTQWLLISNEAFTWTQYHSGDGDFVSSIGGLIKEESDGAVFLIEFATMDSTLVGTPQSWGFTRNATGISLNALATSVTFDQQEEITESPLMGSWLFSGRERDGEMSRRATDGPRKTMKILTGSRFQWIAYHVTNKRFMGTGGGTYTAVDGVYTENIEFFSRDKTRVGASLPFQFERKEDEWHHKGKSSKGDPMYEVWSLREE